MIEIRMPRLSESMKEGKLLVWNVAVGDHVKQGDQVAEVEADKANMEIEAPVAGIVCSLNGKPGENLPVDAILVELQETATHEAEEDSPDASVAQPKPQTAPPPHVESALDRRNKSFSEGNTTGD